MSLKENLRKDLKESLKENKAIRVSVLRQAAAAILNKEKEKRFKLSKEKPEIKEEELQEESQLVDGEIMEVISGESKKRKEAILAYEKGGRKELAEKEQEELEVLQSYLPEQLSEEELKKIVEESIKEVGAVGPKNMGKVMASLMPKVKGRADGVKVSQMVKDLLG